MCVVWCARRNLNSSVSQIYYNGCWLTQHSTAQFSSVVISKSHENLMSTQNFCICCDLFQFLGSFFCSKLNSLNELVPCYFKHCFIPPKYYHRQTEHQQIAFAPFDLFVACILCIGIQRISFTHAKISNVNTYVRTNQLHFVQIYDQTPLSLYCFHLLVSPIKILWCKFWLIFMNIH